MKKLLLLPLLFVGSGVWAETTIFQCTTTNNQQVNITKGAAYLTYKFGKTLENPETNVSVPNKSSKFVVYPQWSSLTLKHKSFIYEINSAYAEQVTIEIQVKENGKKTQIFQCDTSKENYINRLTDEYDYI